MEQKKLFSLLEERRKGDGKKTPLLESWCLHCWLRGCSDLRAACLVSGGRGGRRPRPPRERVAVGGRKRGWCGGGRRLKGANETFLCSTLFVFVLFFSIGFVVNSANWFPLSLLRIDFFADPIIRGLLFFCRSFERGKDLIDKGGENLRGIRRRKI